MENKTKHIRVQTKEEAWQEADKIFPTDYEQDYESSERAGYPVYRGTQQYYSYICDLGDRLEVNFANGKTVNIWFDDTHKKVREQLRAKTLELYPQNSPLLSNECVVQ